MTNLIAQLSISLVLATNWTGIQNGNNELGYVVTNHVATINYEGNEHTLVLQYEIGSVAAWRPKVPPITAYTNGWWNASGLILTNIGTTWITNIDCGELTVTNKLRLEDLPSGKNAL